MFIEEIFLVFDYCCVDGYVISIKFFSYVGVIIENMMFIFKDGKIINVIVEKG